MGHQIIEALLNEVGTDRQWVRMLIAFMEEELGFLVTNKVAESWIRPRGGIRQGDSLSPAFPAVPASHSDTVHHAQKEDAKHDPNVVCR